MKICFLASADSVHSYKWVSYFANIGWEVVWLSTSENRFQKVKGVTFFKLRSPFFLSLYDAIRVIKSTKPSIVHAHYVGKYGLIAALSGFKPIILTAWGSDIIFNSSHFIKKPLVKYILYKSSLITCDAIHMKNAMIKLGVENKKIQVILFGIDTQKFYPEKYKRSINFDQPDDRLVVLSIRDFEPVYNISSLIFAAEIVLSEYSNIEFLLAGKGSLKNEIENLIKKLKLEKNISFSGYISEDKMPEFYNSADICVSTSLSDAGIAGSTAEAMACGLPVIVTDTGENQIWVENNFNGYLIPPNNHELLAEKIISLIKSPLKRKQFGINNVEKIVNCNSYSIEMEKMKVLYENFF